MSTPAERSSLEGTDGGNVGAVGRAMGKAPMQIRRWCHRLQIELSQFRK